MNRTSRWMLGATLAVALAVVAGCATNPVTGKREISLVSPAQEVEIGRAGYGPVIAEYGLYDDAALRTYVDAVGQKIARVSHLPDLEWHFTVLDDPTVNAFAMPGGYIYITRGLLAHLNSEAQLAGVLAHEVGHVTYRHSATMMTKEQLYGAGLALGSIVSPTFQKYSGAAGQALSLLFLKYSRTDETQADELGVAYSTKAGYDSRDFPATYAMLARIDAQSGQRLPGFLSTHPDPGDREQVTAALAQAACAGKTGLVIHHNEHIQHVDNVVYGPDPRQGYFVGDDYFHPTMGFQLRFPAGWKHQDSHASVAAGEPNGAAVMQLSQAQAAANVTPSAFVAQLASKGSITGSRGANETIGGYAAWVGHLDVPAGSGGAAATLDAAFIRKGDVLFQFLGQSKVAGDTFEGQIFTAMRSFRGLTDPARINVAPDRIRVHTAGAAGSFSSLATGWGAAQADLENDSILNNVHVADPISAGTLLKLIARAR